MNCGEVFIPFSKKAVKEYLDGCIRYWRTQVSKDPDCALYYIDAYQSVRSSLFGRRLPIDVVGSSAPEEEQ